MDYGVHDLVGNLGVLAVLLTYLLLQAGKMAPDTIRYSASNAVGALLILYSLTQDFNLSAVVIEVVWLLISLYGIARTLRARRAASAIRQSAP